MLQLRHERASVSRADDFESSAADRLHQLAHAFRGRRGDRIERPIALWATFLPSSFAICSALWKIDLVGDDNLRLLDQLRIEQLELAVDGLPVGQGIFLVDFRGIEQMNQHVGPHHVAQKLVPEAVSFVRSFDKTGNIRDDETLALVVTDDAQIWHQRREGIIGDLRPHGGDRRDQRRFAGVGQADDPDVRQQAAAQIPSSRSWPVSPG